MLAAGRIGKEPEKYGFVDLEYHMPLTFATVEVLGGTRLAAVARAIQVGIGDVAELNPHLVRRMTPPGRVTDVRIPPDRTLVSAYTARPHTTHSRVDLAVLHSEDHRRASRLHEVAVPAPVPVPLPPGESAVENVAEDAAQRATMFFML